MLTVTSNDDNKSTCFKLIGSDVQPQSTHLISDNTSLISTTPENGGLDSCSFYSGPSDATIMAFGDSGESCGSIASGNDSIGAALAFVSSGESCGSIASSTGSSSCSTSFSGGGCSYSC